MNAATGIEKSFRVSLGGDEKVLPQGEVLAYADELHQKHGGVPQIVAVSPPSAVAEEDYVEAMCPPVSAFDEPANDAVTAPTDPAPPVVEGGIDLSAKARIDVQQAVLRAGGLTGIGFKGEGGDGEQFFANGTRMMTSGYDTQRGRKSAFDTAPGIREAGAALASLVLDEQREDRKVSAAEFARSIEVNGKLTAFGHTITEQAIRGLTGRLKSPALSYLLGIRDRIVAEGAKANDVEALPPDRDAMARDRAQIAEVLQHECRRAGDVELKLRTRATPHDIYAVVSPSYSPADAPEVLAQVLDKMPAGARGTHSYDPTSTSWELRAQVWTPTPVDQQAVGEPFAGYVSFRSRDNGTSRFRGGGGIEILRCLNASVYVSEDATTDRIHVGKVLFDVEAMMAGATRAIALLCRAWGVAAEQVVKVPVIDDSPVPLEVAIPGFWRHLLTTRTSELAMLPGRTERNVEMLTKAFGEERRNPRELVRSDFGQAWTRAIQGQPLPVRREAEVAVASWLLSSRPMRCELRDES
jgi:hypothetical protein